jgi:hypothetical protein
MNTTPNKCSDRTLVQPSNAAVTPFKSFCAVVIIFLIRSFDVSFKTDPESALAEGNLIVGIQNLKTSRVSGFSAKEKGNLFDTTILKKVVENAEHLVLIMVRIDNL